MWIETKLKLCLWSCNRVLTCIWHTRMRWILRSEVHIIEDTCLYAFRIFGSRGTETPTVLPPPGFWLDCEIGNQAIEEDAVLPVHTTHYLYYARRTMYYVLPHGICNSIGADNLLVTSQWCWWRWVIVSSNLAIIKQALHCFTKSRDWFVPILRIHTLVKYQRCWPQTNLSMIQTTRYVRWVSCSRGVHQVRSRSSVIYHHIMECRRVGSRKHIVYWSNIPVNVRRESVGVIRKVLPRHIPALKFDSETIPRQPCSDWHDGNILAICWSIRAGKDIYSSSANSKSKFMMSANFVSNSANFLSQSKLCQQFSKSVVCK